MGFAQKLNQICFLYFSFLLHGQEEHVYSEVVKKHNFWVFIICDGNKNV